MDPRQNHLYPMNQINYQYPYTSQKMYINPHFNQAPKPTQTVYYVNPHFYQQNKINNESVNPKIHFNPKFINPQVTAQPQHSTQTRYEYNERNHITLPITEIIKPSDPIVKEISIPISKSRYSIIRNNVTTANSNISTGVQTNTIVPKSTVTINKYKSVHINSVKKILSQNTVSASTSKAPVIENTHKKIPIVHNKDKYKLVKPNVSMPSLIHSKKNKFIRDPNKLRLSLSKCKYVKPGTENTLYNKRLSLTGNMSSKKPRVARNSTNKEIMKVNNIPCPLFKKYGFCIRKTKGNCKYLHDKKHVVICRKFLKGLCHDSDCLLSHELSSKKMPTCDFYLRGMCTKADCPYLHVKLSDNATVCMNFLKGYCENGEKCMKRHINTCPYETKNDVCPKRKCPYPHKKDKIPKENKVYKHKASVSLKNKEIDKVKDTKTSHEGEDSDASNRYYLKQSNDKEKAEDVDVIKPTRCKLGSLPSFIKL